MSSVLCIESLCMSSSSTCHVSRSAPAYTPATTKAGAAKHKNHYFDRETRRKYPTTIRLAAPGQRLADVARLGQLTDGRDVAAVTPVEAVSSPSGAPSLASQPPPMPGVPYAWSWSKDADAVTDTYHPIVYKC